MKTSKFLQVLFILPIVIIPFVGRKTLKRFYLSSLFICLCAILENNIAKRRIWWWYYQKLFQNIPGGLAYIPAKFILSLLTLKFTYGKFIKYLIIDGLFNYLYAFPINSWYKKKGIVSFVRVSPFYYFKLLSIKSLILYGIQIVVERSPKYFGYFYKLVKSKQMAGRLNKNL